MSAIRELRTKRNIYRLQLNRNTFAGITTRGIITGASRFHWTCLGALILSAYKNNVGFAIADHGLTTTQKREISRLGIKFIKHSTPVLYTTSREHTIVAHIKAWWKAWICESSPFDTSIWIDSDAAIVGDISLLFEYVQDKPCMATQESFMGIGTPLYSNLITKVYGDNQRVKDILETLVGINTGVIAWKRGDSLIQEWKEMCASILNSREKLELCGVRDQSAMILCLINRLLRGELGVRLLEDEWNVPGDYLVSKRLKERRKVSNNPHKFLEQACERHPTAKIVHWLGWPKPWNLYE